MANENEKPKLIRVDYRCSCGFYFKGNLTATDQKMDEITAIVTEAHRDKPGHTLTEKKL